MLTDKTVFTIFTVLFCTYTIKDMKRTLLTILSALIVCSPSFGWGREGHETVVKIAEMNLKPSAKKKIEKYLGGHSIVYYAKWMDDVRRTQQYGFTNGWHTAPVNENLEYYRASASGDAIYGLEGAIEALSDYRNMPDSAVAANIKYVLHLTADMHCPAHVKYAAHNMNYDVYMPNASEPMRIHSVWDYGVIQATRIYSATEWAEELEKVWDRKNAKAVTDGTPREWLHDNAVRCEVQFELAKPQEKLGQDFLNASIPLIETQILYAGHRLATILNSLF